jgi:RNA polymerase sigma-70 factor (ECF subfamily)
MANDSTTVHPWTGDAARTTRWTLTVAEPDPAHASTTYDHLDDGALVTACLEGRKDAFDVIVARHRRAVYQVCFRFSGNHEDASDLAQDTFVRVWRGLGGFKGQSAFATWLYRITVNACLNRVQGRKPLTDTLEGDQFVDTRQEDQQAGLLRDERARAVRQAIARLPKKQRATLILRTYQHLSHKEIADVLGSSVGAVKANFFHALANLRKILDTEP